MFVIGRHPLYLVWFCGRCRSKIKVKLFLSMLPFVALLYFLLIFWEPKSSETDTWQKTSKASPDFWKPHGPVDYFHYVGSDLSW
jgi:hypothetical protein